MNSIEEFIGRATVYIGASASVGYLAEPLSKMRSILVLGFQAPVGVNLMNVFAISSAVNFIVQEILGAVIGKGIISFAGGNIAGICVTASITSYPGGAWALGVASLQLLPLTIIVSIVVAFALIITEKVLQILGLIKSPLPSH